MRPATTPQLADEPAPTLGAPPRISRDSVLTDHQDLGLRHER
jgi:hypothetical protein